MRQLRKKTILVLCALALTCLASVGATLAYFSDYSAAEGAVALRLSGQTVIDEGSGSKDKHIVITSTGSSDVVVRVRIFGAEDKMEISPGEGWTQGSDGFYYYGYALSAGQSASAVDAVLKELTEEERDSFDIVVVHESEIAVYNTDGSVSVPDGWNTGAIAAPRQ